MISCIIVDDEPRNVFILQNLLEKFCEDVTVLGAAGSADEAAVLIRERQPEVVFLDIEMPGKNAFDLLEELRPLHFEVVFVTAFDKYAIRAFRIGAIDYLLKPVSIDDLRQTTRRLTERKGTDDTNQRVENYLDAVKQPGAPDKLVLNLKDGLGFFEISTIQYCLASGAYTEFHFADNRKVLTTGTLKSFEDVLPEEKFIRIHHSSIINLDYVKSYTKGRGGFITMADGTRLDVSQRKKSEFLTRLDKK